MEKYCTYRLRKITNKKVFKTNKNWLVSEHKSAWCSRNQHSVSPRRHSSFVSTLSKTSRVQNGVFPIKRLYSCADPYNGLASPSSPSPTPLGLCHFFKWPTKGSYSIWVGGWGQENFWTVSPMERDQTRSLLVNNLRLKLWPNAKRLVTKHDVWSSGQTDKTFFIKQRSSIQRQRVASLSGTKWTF